MAPLFLLKFLLKRLSVGLMLWRRKSGVCVFANAASQDILGTKPRHIKDLKEHLSGTHGPEDMLLAGESRVFHAFVQSKDGLSFVDIRPFPFGKGMACFLVQKARLGLGTETAKQLANATPVPGVLHNHKNDILFCNDALKAWVPVKDYKRLARNLDGAKAQKDRNISILGAGGHTQKGSLSHFSPIQLSDDLLLSFLCPQVAVKAPKEKALLGMLLAGFPMPVLLVDSQGYVLAANQSFEKLASCRKVLGRFFGAWIEDKTTDDCLLFLRKAQKEKGPQGPLAAQMNLRPAMHMNLYISPIAGGVWDPLGCYFIAFHDCSAQKHREEQLLKAQKLQAIGELATGISHDFNNLLTAMIGFCDLLLERHQPHDRSFTDIMQVKQNANRAASLIKQLLRFSRSDDEEDGIMDLRDCLNEISFVLRRLLGPSVDLKIEHSRFARLIRANQGQFEQVVMNLAINARDAMPSGGTLLFKTHLVNLEKPQKFMQGALPKGEYVMLEVVDTGEGIPPQILERIFNPFFSTKGVDQGTGLGLATVQQIIQRLKGAIHVASEPNVGTRFQLYLPHIPKEVAPLTETGGPNLKNTVLVGRGSILLVDDEDPVRLFATRALRGKGYEVFESKDAAKGLTILKQNPQISLLISDVMMAGMDGPALANACFQERKDLKVLFVSGYPEEGIQMKLDFPKAQVHFLPKPFNLDNLVSKVFEIMGKKKASA